MKNPHGVEPTRFMKRNGSKCAIGCNRWSGPIFDEIFIRYKCNKENSCYIHNDGKHAYKCHPEYKSSLFVNTAGPDEENNFSLLDYEVYTH